MQRGKPPKKAVFGVKMPEIAVSYSPPISSFTNNLSIASFTSSKLAGLGISVSMQESSWGGLPVNMTIRVEGERILITWASSAPTFPTWNCPLISNHGSWDQTGKALPLRFGPCPRRSRRCQKTISSEHECHRCHRPAKWFLSAVSASFPQINNSKIVYYVKKKLTRMQTGHL